MRPKAKRLPAEKAGTAKGVLSVDDVCAIIRTCQAANVSSLKFRGLELELHPNYVREVVNVDVGIGGHPSMPPPADANPRRTEAELQAMRLRMRELDGNGPEHGELIGGLDKLQSIETIENEMEQLCVTDPLAYEQMMNGDQEFEDAKPS